MTVLPIREVSQLEAGMFVKSGTYLCQLAYYPGEEFYHHGQWVQNHLRNKWFAIILRPKKQKKQFAGKPILVCFDLVFSENYTVFRAGQEDLPLTTPENRFIAFPA